MLKIFSKFLAGKKTHFLGEIISFDENGHVHLENEKAQALAQIPGFEVVNGEPAKTDKKGKDKPAPVAPATPAPTVETPEVPTTPAGDASAEASTTKAE